MKDVNKNLLNERGFTLVELSIVLVIIGFLIAGVSAGNNLIKQAQLRSVITDFQQYATTYNNFLTKYSKVPGDMDTAYYLWNTNCAASSAICAGNNNGVINYDNASTTNNEVNKAWKHLQLAGMLNANIVPVTATTTAIGTNAPASKISGGGYIMAGNITPFSTTTNAVFLGAPLASDTLLTGILNPDSAWSIDQKMDDGGSDASGNFVGGTSGIIRSLDGSGATAGACVASATGYYNMTTTSSACRIGMALN